MEIKKKKETSNGWIQNQNNNNMCDFYVKFVQKIIKYAIIITTVLLFTFLVKMYEMNFTEIRHSTCKRKHNTCTPMGMAKQSNMFWMCVMCTRILFLSFSSTTNGKDNKKTELR